jgi:hypothetical protein
LFGKKKEKAQEALSEAKELIIKVKKKGIDTSRAQKIYKEAKKAIKNRRYKEALEIIETAEKSAKRAYAKGIKERLELRISSLDERIEEMKKYNLDTKKLNKLLKKARATLKKGIKEYKHGLKAAKEGLKIAEDKLEKFNKVSKSLSSTAWLLKRIEDFSPDIVLLEDLSIRMVKLENMKAQGKVEDALKGSKELEAEVKKVKERYSKAYESVKSLEKVMRDAEILGAEIEAEPELQEARNLMTQGEFEKAWKTADKTRKKISEVLGKYKDAKHHVDLAEEKVSEAKTWGFSAYEVKKILEQAKEALARYDFEKAIELSKESLEKAGTIRERHKRSLVLIQSAKDEVDKVKENGFDVSEMESILKEAENDFDKGDYGALEEKINDLLGRIRGLG